MHFSSDFPEWHSCFLWCGKRPNDRWSPVLLGTLHIFTTPNPTSLVKWVSLNSLNWVSQGGFCRQRSLQVLCESCSTAQYVWENSVCLSWKLTLRVSPLKVQRSYSKETCLIFSNIIDPSSIRLQKLTISQLSSQGIVHKNTLLGMAVGLWAVLTCIFFSTTPHKNFVITK